VILGWSQWGGIIYQPTVFCGEFQTGGLTAELREEVHALLFWIMVCVLASPGTARAAFTTGSQDLQG